MITINDISEVYFELDGINYPKIYQTLEQGSSTIGIYNIFDTRQQLVSSTSYDKYIIDGIVYTTQEKAITALLDVVYSTAAEIAQTIIKNYNTENNLFQTVENNTYTGTVTNAPDGEDLEEVVNVLKLKDRDGGFDSIGYKIIRSGFDFASIPVNYKNSIWEIRYEHDLSAQDIIFPENVTLKFNGGYISNYGILTGDNTKIEAGFHKIFDISGSFSGTWKNKEVYSEWFGAISDGVVDCTNAINKSLELKNIRLIKGNYNITNSIVLNSDCSIIGTSGTVLSGIASDAVPFISFDNGDINNILIKDFKIDNLTRANSTAISGLIDSQSANDIDNIKIINIEMNVSGELNCGILFLNALGTFSNIEIRDCELNCTGERAYGILLQKRTDGVDIIRNYITLPHVGSYNSIAIYANSNNFNVLNNSCQYSGHSHIAVSNGSIGNITGNNVLGIALPEEAGIEVEWKVSHYGSTVGHDVSITGNTIIDCNIGVLITKRDLTNLNQVYNITVVGNIIKDSQYGIYAKYLDRGIFSSNVIENCAINSIYVSACNNINIVSNSISEALNAISIEESTLINICSNIIETELSSIVGLQNNNNIIITNNNLKSTGNGSGINLADVNEGFKISGNILEFGGITTGSGIRITSGDKGVISENILKGFVAFGIRLEASANNTIVDSNIIDNQGSSQNLGAGNKFRNNEGIAEALQIGSSAARPTFLYNGITYLDTTLGYQIWHDGTSWINAQGATI